MAEKPRRIIRTIECPEGRGRASLLVEWRIKKGKKTLHSVSCNNPRLMDYSGDDCQWHCWERVAGEKC